MVGGYTRDRENMNARLVINQVHPIFRKETGQSQSMEVNAEKIASAQHLIDQKCERLEDNYKTEVPIKIAPQPDQ